MSDETCKTCGGTGSRDGYHDGKCRCQGMFHVCRSYKCPTCGGSGVLCAVVGHRVRCFDGPRVCCRCLTPAGTA